MHEVPGYAKTIDGWMTDSELAWLYRTARSMSPDAVYVEVGSWKGRSTAAVCEGLAAVAGARAWSVDTFRGDAGVEAAAGPTDTSALEREFRMNTARFDCLTLLVADSADAAATFADRSVDWIFIDADHSYEAVARDIRAWAPKLKDRGLMSGHDFGDPGVRDAVCHSYETVSNARSIWYTNSPRRPAPATMLRRGARSLRRRTRRFSL